MKLEGSLDAFSLPDIFRLLATTQKTGALHLTGEGRDGHVHFAEGAITAAADKTCPRLGMRLVAAAQLDEAAIDRLARASATEGLVKALVASGAVEPELIAEIFTEHIVDVIGALLRWTDGAFVFSVDEPNSEDAGLLVDVEQVVIRARDRVDQWDALRSVIPASDTVLALAATVQQDAVLDPEEWAVLSLVDGERSVRDIAMMTGAGEYLTTRPLAALVERGLIVGRDERNQRMAAVQHRLDLLARLSDPTEVESAGPELVREMPAVLQAAEPEEAIQVEVVTAVQPEPGIARQRTVVNTPAVPVQAPAVQPLVASVSASASASAQAARQLGPVLGNVVAEPVAEPAPLPETMRSVDNGELQDSAVSKSLLLRLIAGVRSL